MNTIEKLKRIEELERETGSIGVSLNVREGTVLSLDEAATHVIAIMERSKELCESKEVLAISPRSDHNWISNTGVC